MTQPSYSVPSDAVIGKSGGRGFDDVCNLIRQAQNHTSAGRHTCKTTGGGLSDIAGHEPLAHASRRKIRRIKSRAGMKARVLFRHRSCRPHLVKVPSERKLFQRRRPHNVIERLIENAVKRETLQPGRPPHALEWLIEGESECQVSEPGWPSHTGVDALRGCGTRSVFNMRQNVDRSLLSNVRDTLRSIEEMQARRFSPVCDSKRQKKGVCMNVSYALLSDLCARPLTRERTSSTTVGVTRSGGAIPWSRTLVTEKAFHQGYVFESTVGRWEDCRLRHFEF